MMAIRQKITKSIPPTKFIGELESVTKNGSPAKRGSNKAQRNLGMELVYKVKDNHPLSVVISGANVHDMKSLEETIDSASIRRPLPIFYHPKHICLHKGTISQK